MTRWVLLPVLVALLLPAAARGQEVAVTGLVTSTIDNQPLANVRISHAGEPRTPPALSDAFGRFAIRVPRATRAIVLNKPGFARRQVAVTAGPLVVQMEPGAVISGRVTDDAGEPVVGARITVWEKSGATITADTDDRGEYRLSVNPGEGFIVSANTGSVAADVRRTGNGTIGVVPARAVTYFPGTATPEEAAELVLKPGEERGAIDFAVSTAQSGNQVFSAFASFGVLMGRVGPEPAGPRGTVEGRVTDSTGRHLSNAQVVLAGERAGNSRQIGRSDAGGRFTFGNVPEGPISVRASKPGYGMSERRFTLPAAAPREAVAIELVPWSAISGCVVDELGEPVQDARVQLLRARFQSGERRLEVATDTILRTNDRGEYRAWALEPGTYVVSATVSGIGTVDLAGYASSYAPGVSDAAAAQRFTIAAGQEVVSADVELVRAPTFRVAGRLLDASGGPAGGSLRLLPVTRSSDGTMGPGVGGRLEADGRFEFTNVPQGTYVIQSYRGRTNSTAEGPFSAMRVTVADGDVTGLMLQSAAGSTIAGTVIPESDDPLRRPPRAGIEIAPIPVDFESAPMSNWATAGVREDGRFQMTGITGQRRLQATRVPTGWAVREIRINGIDVTDRPMPFGQPQQSVQDVEIVLTDRIGEVTGRVLDARGRPVAAAAIVAFSTSRDRWYPVSRYLRRAVTRDDGTFSMPGLPGDRYYVALQPASPDGDRDAWQDPLLLEELSARAASVTLIEGQRVSVDLKAE